jgi:hypothetical protein
MIRTAYYFLIIFTLHIGCSTVSEQECESDECLKQQAYDSVIEVHDEVMAKMSAISELKGRIEEQMNTAPDTMALAEWYGLMENLDKSDKAMYDWMHNFNSDMDEMPIDDALVYLKSEKVKIDNVAKEINRAIERAEKRLRE